MDKTHSPRKIDMHAHHFPVVSRADAAILGDGVGPWLRMDGSGNHGHIMLGDNAFRPVTRNLWDAHTRLEDMDAQGVDIQISCATPVMFGYSAEPKTAADWSTRMNDYALEFASANPARLKVLAQVPMQDLDLACKEASRAMKTGHAGVQIGNHVGDKDMDDALMVQFLTHCAHENIPVLAHPWDMMGGNRMKKWMLPWLVAMPAETQLGILSLILSGAFERIPQTLKLCFAHGGGSFAYLLGRVDNAWTHRDIIRQDCPHIPSSYVNRFSVDSAVFDTGALRLLTDVMGTNHVMLGSDYPFPLGEANIGSLIAESDFLSPDQQHQITVTNAMRFFSL